MSGKTDFLQLWKKACSGTSFAQDDVSELLRKHAISTLVKQPPGRSAMETADRIRAMIKRNQGDQEQARIVVSFLSSVPASTPIKTVVGGLWI
ncbi:hypothetical protein [Asaia bogorensis]|uniref:hypothetical protein n=1 Tax=Asaia bogorensis TaxID=91915 RepID=UPI000EFCC821|nr:hypothetical protein [Asaia bogorensis]